MLVEKAILCIRINFVALFSKIIQTYFNMKTKTNSFFTPKATKMEKRAFIKINNIEEKESDHNL